MRSTAHEALEDQLAGHELPRSTGADAFRLVSGALPSSDAATVLAALTVLRELREELAGWEPRLIQAARDLGVSWNELAPALGVASRQAAERRYLRLRPPSADEAVASTREERVQNERGRRAETRAVNDWARTRAATLRIVAARVSELRGSSALDEPTQRAVDRVDLSLAGDDIADLLASLIAIRPDLAASHPDVARSIGDLMEQADELRASTRQERSPTKK